MQHVVVIESNYEDDFACKVNSYLSEGYRINSSACSAIPDGPNYPRIFYQAILVKETPDTQQTGGVVV